MNINFGYCCHYSIVAERNNIAQVESKQSQSKIFKPKIHLTKQKYAARQKKHARYLYRRLYCRLIISLSYFED